MQNTAKKEVWSLRAVKNTDVFGSHLILSGGTEERKKTSFRVTGIIIVDAELTGNTHTAENTAKSPERPLKKREIREKLNSGRTLVEININLGFGRIIESLSVGFDTESLCFTACWGFNDTRSVCVSIFL